MNTKLSSIEEFGRWLSEEIETQSKLMDNDLGWRFLSCPLRNIDYARTVFIGINPGGIRMDSRNDGLSVEAGSSYRIESWGENLGAGESPLQKQVLALFKLLSEDPDQVLSGNLIPFRSARLVDLKDRQAAERFGKFLWSRILERSPAKRFVTMGNLATEAMANVLEIQNLDKHYSGWGKVSIRTGSASGRQLIGLPHLSTFKLLSRPNCVQILNNLFNQ